MGAVPKEKAGVGSAVNDATRLLGGTLGVAVIGSVYASLYASRLTSALPSGLPKALTHAAHESVGAALEVSTRLSHSGRANLAGELHQAASGAFIHGLGAGCLVAGGVAIAGAIMAVLLLPAQPLPAEPLPAEPAAAATVGPLPASSRSATVLGE
jgi:hypothetical protein